MRQVVYLSWETKQIEKERDNLSMEISNICHMQISTWIHMILLSFYSFFPPYLFFFWIWIDALCSSLDPIHLTVYILNVNWSEPECPERVPLFASMGRMAIQSPLFSLLFFKRLIVDSGWFIISIGENPTIRGNPESDRTKHLHVPTFFIC
jgi:hypothetical protein